MLFIVVTVLLAALSLLSFSGRLDRDARSATRQHSAPRQVHDPPALESASQRARCPPPPELVAECHKRFPLKGQAKTVCVGETQFALLVWSTDDTVSKSVLTKNVWERNQSSGIIAALQDGGALLDIGANIGWFTLNTAARGFEVYAFEPMLQNYQLLSHSLCLNPWMNVTAFNFGLAEASMDCEIISHEQNKGNGITVCRNQSESLGLQPEQASRGAIKLRRLDDILPPQATIGVVKVDIEGFEARALALGGADLLFARSPPRQIFSEFFPAGQKTQGKTEPLIYLDFMEANGYSFDNKGLSSKAYIENFYNSNHDVVFTRQANYNPQ